MIANGKAKPLVDNLPYLKMVALQDVNRLYEKEKQYNGSWKRSGGRSSWMMLVRKIDRIREIMRRPEPPANFDLTQTLYAVENLQNRSGTIQEKYLKGIRYLAEVSTSEDIFAKIIEEETASGGKGLDGSCIAEIRDLRSYLLLVESEMVARGILPKIRYDTEDDESLHAEYNDGA